MFTDPTQNCSSVMKIYKIDKSNKHKYLFQEESDYFVTKLIGFNTCKNDFEQYSHAG